MVGVISDDGTASPPYFFEGSMDTIKYKKHLIYQVLPALNGINGEDGYIWMQDGAPVHESNAGQKYLQRQLGSKRVWSKE